MGGQRVPWPVRRRAERLPAGDPPARLGRRTAGQPRRSSPRTIPDRGTPLPRALAAHVMAQVEQPANLDRQDNPAYRLITMILIRCGLRISSAAAPALRLPGHRRRRRPLPALLQHQDETRGPRPHRRRTRSAMIGEQQQRVPQRWPAGAPVLFPRPTRNLDGTQARLQPHLPAARSTAGWRTATSATSTASPST